MSKARAAVTASITKPAPSKAAKLRAVRVEVAENGGFIAIADYESKGGTYFGPVKQHALADRTALDTFISSTFGETPKE